MRYEKDIILFINEELQKQLKKCVDKAIPNESCGLIFGKIEEIKNQEKIDDYFYHYIANRFECIESDQKSPISFLISQEQKLDEIYKTAKLKFNLNLISIFHSHPAGNHPSSTDLRNMEYLDHFKIFKRQIWSIMDARKGKLNGFMYLNDEFIQVNVKIIEE